MKPLFIPLKAEFYDAFSRGEKDTEYRMCGAQWNCDTCRIGRKVVLSRGYGKQHRLTGEIVGYAYDVDKRTIKGWRKCYGRRKGAAVAIKIKVDR